MAQDIDRRERRENVAPHTQKAPPKRGFLPYGYAADRTKLLLALLRLAMLRVALLRVSLLAALARLLLLLLARTRVAALLTRVLTLARFLVLVVLVLIGHLVSLLE
jgi:hypothetical protein